MRYRRLSYSYALLQQPAPPVMQTAWRPAADVYETRTHICVTVELPGVEPEGVDVVFFENALVIEGQRSLPKLDAGGIYHSAEIRRGPFRLEIPLRARVETEPVELHGELGLLSIRLARVVGTE